MDFGEIEKRIGYTFRNKELLQRALTHASATKFGGVSYQNLEFLGDSIIGFSVAKRLLELYPEADEGELTKMRAAIVSRQPLADEVDRLGLTEFVIVGKGENKSRIMGQTKMRSDIFESVTAAVYLDCASFDVVDSFVLSSLSEAFDAVAAEFSDDYKSELNELAAKRGLAVEYFEISVSGPAHNPEFEYGVKINGVQRGIGKGGKKSLAQQLAAKQALNNLR